jgi:hypothetical protein
LDAGQDLGRMGWYVLEHCLAVFRVAVE